MNKTTIDKKSFIIHNDSVEVLEKLSNDQAGQLFKAICNYQVNGIVQLDYPLDLVFLPFQKQFDRDNKKYINTCKQRALAGSKGGKQKVANASNCKQKVANLADSDSKNDSKSDSDSKNDNEKNKALDRFESFWNNYPKKTDKKKTRVSFIKLSKEKQTLAVSKCKNQYSSREKQYIPAPLVYLNGEKWDDELDNNSQANNKITIHNW